jgi:hypothetical protein
MLAVHPLAVQPDAELVHVQGSLYHHRFRSRVLCCRAAGSCPPSAKARDDGPECARGAPGFSGHRAPYRRPWRVPPLIASRSASGEPLTNYGPGRRGSLDGSPLRGPCSRVGYDVLNNDDDLPVRTLRDRVPDGQAVRRKVQTVGTRQRVYSRTAGYRRDDSSRRLIECDRGHRGARHARDERAGLCGQRLDAAPLAHEYFELAPLERVTRLGGTVMSMTFWCRGVRQGARARHQPGRLVP